MAGDNDLDGLSISVSSVDLNGGTMKISINGVIQDANTALPSNIDSSGLLVDTDGPGVSSLSVPMPGTYLLNDPLTFIITFDEPVYITGTPQLSLNFNGSIVKANYLSGTGGSTIVFRHHVATSDIDNDSTGIVLSPAIELNGGSITDLSGNNADLTFTSPNLTLVNVDGDIPFVTDYMLPPNKTYYNGEMLEIDLKFNEIVNVTGSPKLILDIGGSNENASYLTGSGTDTLRFRYIVKTGDKDTNGITINSMLDLSAGTIQDLGGEDALENINPPLTPYIYVNGDIPTITSISAPADNNYTTGQNLDFVVHFSENVYVTGSPNIALSLDSGTVIANYMLGSGSKNLTFRYTVAASDQDNNGPSFSSTTLNLGIGSIKSTATAQNADLNYNGTEPSLSNVRINENPATQLVIVQQPSDAYVNTNISPSIAVEIRDAANNLVTSATDNVTLAIGTNPSAGSLAGTVTVAAVGGIATFSDIQINNAGVGYTLTAISGVLTGATSSSFNILSTNPTQLAFVTQPSNTVARSNIAPTITVEIQDAGGNLVSTATDNVTLAFGTDPSSGAATLGGTLTVAAVGGVATFSDINIDKAFSGYTLGASATGLTAATSATFNITAAPAVKLVFSQEPTSSNYNTNITPAITVEIQDAYGNVTPSSDIITLAINNNPSAGSLSGTTSVAAVNGTATFLDIQIDNVGVGYTLDATATGLTTATSTGFDIITVPTQLIITQGPSDAYNNTNISPAITVEIRDAANNLVIGATDNITVSFGVDASGGSATLGGSLTVAAVGGIATFNNLNIDEVASGYTLYFAATGLTGAASASFNITQAPATQLAFIQEPSNTVAGVNITPAITVEIQDANGNIVPTATDNVTIAFATDPSTGSATLAGTLSVAAVNGVATFSDIYIDKAFSGYTLGASATGLTAATSASFNITAATKTALAFIQEPSNSPYNTNISPAITVNIVDAYGNKTADTDTITLAINNNPGGGTLSGTLAIAAVAGTATFSDIQIDNSGVGYTLDATATGLTSATSTAFDITQVATQIVITQEPSDAYNSTAISPAIIVELRDATNNLVTGATNNVTVAIGTNPAAGTLGGTLTVAAVGGVATFNDLEIDNVGVGYTLDFSAGGLTGASSISFDITQAPATKLAFVQQPTNAVAGVNIAPAITVEIRDANDNVVPTATDNITIGYNTDPSAGAATLGGTLTVAAINGVATFSDINLDKAFIGYTLQATATGLTAASSTNFNITPATKAKLAFLQQPSNTEYSSNISPAMSVEIQDAFGNKTTDTDSITLAINNNPTGGTLSGTLSVAAIAGTATFGDISIDSAGVGYTLNATATGLTSVTSTSFDITATATQLVITQEPSDAYNSTAIAPAITVELRDAQNNKVTSATDNVSVAITTDPSGSATLGGTTTVAAIAGVATFSDLEIDKVGTGYVLTFTSGELTSAVSTTFNITQAPATQVAFVQNPTNTVAGTNISPAITVEIQDSNGNKVPGAINNVSLAFGTDPSSGAATLGGTLTVAAVDGVATFSDINIDKAFTGYTLQAGAAGLSADTSSLFNITPATKSKLSFVQEPSDSEYNTNIAPAITVEIQDTYGNKTADTDNITIAINNNPTAGTLSGTTTVAAVAGVATFSDLQINNVGIGYTLDATTGGLVTATSSAFNISATPTQLVITQGPTNSNNDTVIAPNITIEIRDASNTLVSSSTANVTLAFGSDPSAGAATIGGTVTVAAVGGVATFNDITIDTVNTGYTFTFTSTGLTSATSGTFDITQAPATQLAFIQNPSNAVAGASNAPAITIEIQDAGGNKVPTATDNITLTFGTDPSAGAATIGGTVTVAAVAGLATFNDITVDKAFNGYTLSAGATGLTSATSTAFNITPATKAALAFSQEPSNADQNTNIAPAITVDIVDAYGNKTADTDSITLAINNNPSTGTLSGTTSVAAVAGTATFSDIQIDNGGIGYTLDATATGLTAATSTTFNISSTPTQIIITQQPSDAQANVAIAPAITLELRDALNNLVIDATNSITVAIGTNPSGGTLTGTLNVNAVAGIATFSDLEIDNVGTGYTLTFSAAGLTGVTSATFDILSNIPTVDITTAGNILDDNKSTYTVSGNCSEDTRIVTVHIGGISYTPTCSGGIYSTGAVDVSSLEDGPVSITADHDDGVTSATQASTNVIKDVDIPDIISNTIASNTYNLSEVITLTLNFDQNVIVTGTPRVELYFNSQSATPLYANYSGGSGGSALTFVYTIAAGDADPDGIQVDPMFEIPTGSIQDTNGNDATPNLVTTSFPTVLVDSAVPSITSFIEPVDGTYPDGVGLLFQVNFNEAVNVTGTPRISINLGGTTVYATYKTGTGTAGLEFEYIVQPGDEDADGITLNSTSIELDSGTIKGLDNDDAVLGFELHLNSMTGVIVDTTSGITPPDQVTNLTAAPTTSNTELALSWAIPADNGTAIINYSVQYREQGQSTWINSTPNAITNQATVNGLSAGIIYEFRVAANNGLLGPFSVVETAEIFDVMSLDPVAWLDATNVNGDGTSPANGVKVNTWVDLTGAATDATEANPANQPVMAYNVQNGLPAVRFDNHDRGLQGSFDRVNGTSLTFVIVGQFDNGYSDRCLFEFRSGGARGFFIDQRYASNTNYSPILTKGGFQLWTIENTGGTASVVENGTTTLFNGGIDFNTNFTGTGTYTLGDDDTGGNRMYGYIAEFLVFDRALSAQDIQVLENYLKNKWGTP